MGLAALALLIWLVGSVIMGIVTGVLIHQQDEAVR